MSAVELQEFYKQEFLLDPDIVFLNHGGFGATPKKVFESYQRWQLQLEREPVDFISRTGEERMAAARAVLARYLGTHPDDVVYVTNATYGLNIVAQSLRLGPGDEVLASAHEHGGVERMWRYFARHRGFTYRAQPTPLPVTTHAQYVEDFWAGVRDNTRAIFLSHIASPTALILPIEEICRRARRAGILTIIDGAHVPGQIPLDVEAVGADFYAGILHKWLCTPKGSGFLHARREVQDLLQPLCASWGVEPMNPGPSPFVDRHEWQGTRDPAAFLATDAAIAFQQEPRWAVARERCRQLTREAHGAISELTGLAPFNPPTDEWNAQMVALPLPAGTDADALLDRLFHEHQIEVSVATWGVVPKIRVSIQAYNSRADLEALLNALERLL